MTFGEELAALGREMGRSRALRWLSLTGPRCAAALGFLDGLDEVGPTTGLSYPEVYEDGWLHGATLPKECDGTCHDGSYPCPK